MEEINFSHNIWKKVESFRKSGEHWDSKIHHRGWKVCSKIKRYSAKVLTTFCSEKYPSHQLCSRTALAPASSWQSQLWGRISLQESGTRGGIRNRWVNSWGESELRDGLAQLPRQAGFHSRARSRTLFSTQVLFARQIFKQIRWLSCQESLCPQLPSLTANKSTNTSAPVPRSRFTPDQTQDNFLQVFFQGLPHSVGILFI